MPRKVLRTQKLSFKKRIQNQSAFKDHFSSFNQKLNIFSLTLIDVIGDGNCMFRSIADQLEGQEQKHMKYRKLAVNEIKKNQSFYQSFLPDSLVMKEYIEIMTQDGVWGGHFELQALCNALKIDIAVHSFNTSILINGPESNGGLIRELLTLCLKCFNGKKQSSKTINIAFHKGPNIIEHYSSIRYHDDDNDRAQPIKQDVLEVLFKTTTNQNKQKKINEPQITTILDNTPQDSLERENEDVPLHTLEL